MSGHIVVGGGTGFIGTHLIPILRNKGYAVTTISRMPGPQRISWTDLQTQGLPNDTTGVVNLAGQNVMDSTQRWTAGFKQNIFNSRINTTRALAKCIKNASPNKPKVFVSMSGVGVYKPNQNNVTYTEESEVEIFDFFSKLCKEWEKAAEIENNCRVVTIRSGVVLGRNGGMIRQLYLPFYLGLGGPVGNGLQFLPWIHIDDLCRMILFALEQDSVCGILNGVAPESATNGDFSKAFAKALNRPALLATPKFVLNLLLGYERAKMITEGQKVLPKRPLSLGFSYDYPTIDKACHDIVTRKS